jgi:uncharacterized protein (DUF3084 family)
MVTLDRLQARREELAQQERQLAAQAQEMMTNLHAVQGAVAVLDQLIREAQGPQEREPERAPEPEPEAAA